MAKNCGNCKYFIRSDGQYAWRGYCNFEMPPMVKALAGDGNLESFTREDRSCDLFTKAD